jgi:uncharacterized protein (TIGR03118 family)
MRLNSLRLRLGIGSAVSVLILGCGGSGGSNTTVVSAGKFVQTNLVADTSGKAAVTDPNLVNPWGITASPTGPLWVSDNGTGLATVYTGAGAVLSLVVAVPAAGGKTNGPVSGQIFNSTTDFALTGGVASAFLFVNEDGVVSGWGGGAAAVAMADRSATGAVYKGLAMAQNGGANFLYATNFNANTIDVFDKSFTFASSFTDSQIPTGYAPFGIQNIGGLLYVTFALQDSAKHDDVAGAGNGYVDIFNPNGTLVKRFISRGSLNSPWALVQAPTGFGSLAGALLVGNFGDGKINAYNITTGQSMGVLSNTSGSPLVIQGLWGLLFGNGASAGPATTLYFTAGPGAESHGLLGSLTAQ